MLINEGEVTADVAHEEDQKLILQTLNCSELKLSSLSITTSVNKQTIGVAPDKNGVSLDKNKQGTTSL